MSILIGFRANPIKHKRILAWLGLFEEGRRSEELRRLIELGIDVREGKVYHAPNSIPAPAEPTFKLDWRNVIPKEPTVRQIGTVQDNILAGFDE